MENITTPTTDAVAVIVAKSLEASAALGKLSDVLTYGEAKRLRAEAAQKVQELEGKLTVAEAALDEALAFRDGKPEMAAVAAVRDELFRAAKMETIRAARILDVESAAVQTVGAAVRAVRREIEAAWSGIRQAHYDRIEAAVRAALADEATVRESFNPVFDAARKALAVNYGNPGFVKAGLDHRPVVSLIFNSALDELLRSFRTIPSS